MIEQSYNLAREQYKEFGVDTEEILEQLKKISISIYCWQGDEVSDFEKP
ncbi:MAG: L-rhamnose isomerase [Promethearchaeota archaeon]